MMLFSGKKSGFCCFETREVHETMNDIDVEPLCSLVS